MRLDDGRFGDAVDIDKARFVLTRRPGAVAAPDPDARSCGSRGARRSAGRVVLSGAQVVNLIDRVDELAGPRRAGDGAASPTRTLDPRTGTSRSPGAWSGWRRRRRSTSRSRTSSWRPCCATAVRTRTPARCCSPSSGAGARRCRSPAKLWGYLQDWTVAYGYRPGRAAVWMAVLWAAGARGLLAVPTRRRSRADEAPAAGTPRCTRWICCCP